MGTKISRKTRQASRDDRPGSQGQVDARGIIVTPVLEEQGVVRPEELYTLQEFKHRLGISDSTLRAARRSGLRVCYIHRHAFVYGRDWIDYVLHSQGKASQLVES
jgi:hypothetical protein